MHAAPTGGLIPGLITQTLGGIGYTCLQTCNAELSSAIP